MRLFKRDIVWGIWLLRDFSMFMCAGLKYKKVLVFSYLVLKHFIIGNGDTQNNRYSSFLVAGWLDPSHCSNSVFIIWWFWCTWHKTQVSDLWEKQQTDANRLRTTVSLRLSDLCTAASRIPLFIFFPRRPSWFKTSIVIPKTVHRRLTAHTVSPTVAEIFLKAMVFKSPLLIET